MAEKSAWDREIFDARESLAYSGLAVFENHGSCYSLNKIFVHKEFIV